tara:strand:- start:17 stop:286 length:270 start_codon:yes stop_codon:yes gene_type:complete
MLKQWKFLMCDTDLSKEMTLHWMVKKFKMVSLTITLAFLATVLTGVSTSFAAGAGGLPRVTQELVAPPFLPKHNQVAVGGPKWCKCVWK